MCGTSIRRASRRSSRGANEPHDPRSMSATILVVEDEPQVQELVAVNLEHAGHRVRRAATAGEAESSIREELPDVLIVDWMLPDESGLSLTRRLRENERTRGLPILMLTARAM